MYIASARDTEFRGNSSGRIVSANVIALGAVSLVTDVSSEMVTAILPLYLVLGLGFSPLQFGILDGLYSGVTAFVRVIGGTFADRWQRRKLMAGIGYGISAVAKLGLMSAGSSASTLGVVLAADRTGKGLRTAPRDALISLSSTPDTLGRAFGVHRAMDTIGALLGPLVAFVLLWTVAGGYDVVFFVSFCFAVLGVLLLVLFVHDHSGPVRQRVSLRAAFGLLRDNDFRRVCGWTVVLGLVTVGDSFVYLLLQSRLDIEPAYFAMLPLGTAAVYLTLAVPVGWIADRVGRWRMFLIGHVLLLGAYVALVGAADGIALLCLTLLAHGAFYACTDGVLMAAASPLVPAELRTSGMALLQTGQAVAKMFSAVLFGLAWTVWGMQAAVITATVAFGAVVALACVRGKT
ncbi:MFS transporter [Kibdelosporangium philippinense]|uniref:MFS transporter n=1 Tax=Kibdelosporangium philippinense TaxID=211113 RepID=A0ABS8ZCQ4_9PSEU|nr:MFS transporter [Kibdelosporangium philippinense]MCE7004466.1 MFS transporter [Kibdelosporangium philippinense]